MARQSREWSENLLAISKEEEQMREKKELTRRDFLRLSAAAATGAIVAACAPATPQIVEKEVIKEVEKVVTATPRPVTGPVTIRYTHVADPGELEIRQANIADFEEKYPDIKLVEELVPEDGMAQKITTMVAGGAAPDTVYLHPSMVPLYAEQNVLLPQDDMADSDAEFGADDFFDVTLDYFVYKGKTYGYPYYSGPIVTFYNKTMFDEMGVEYPTEYSEGFKDGKDEWTRDQMLELAQRLTKGTGAEKTFGVWATTNSLHWLCAVIWSFGGNVWDEDMTKCLLTEPAAIEALKFQTDLFVKYNVAPLPDQQEGLPGGFLSGKCGMDDCGIRADVPGMKGLDWEVGIAPVPKGPAGRFCRNGPNAQAIVATTRFPEACWEFVKYMCGPKPGELGGQRFEFEQQRAIPSRRSLFDSPAFLDNLLPWEDAEVYRDAADHVRPFPLPARYAEIQTAWREQWDAILLGQKSVEEAAKAGCQAMDEFLAGA